MLKEDLKMARKIARAIDKKGGKTFFVGGYVRDKILGRTNKDIDLEIHEVSPEVLRSILEELGEVTVMGASFGVLGLKGYDLDIAQPRREKANGCGHKDFTVDVDPFIGTYTAARRRDFNVNTIMEDVLTKEIIDHFGGLRDLKERIIRHVDEETFVEDPLRVLRAAQQAARFVFAIAPETIAIAKTMSIKVLAKERIFGETMKALLKAEKPSLFFQSLRLMDQLHDWFPELESLIGVVQSPVHHPEGDAWNHTMMVLDYAASIKNLSSNPAYFMIAALCHDFGKATTTEVIDGKVRAFGHEVAGVALAEKFLARVSGECKLTKYVLNMVELHMTPNQLAGATRKNKSFCKMFAKSICPKDLLLLAEADHFGRALTLDYSETKALLNENLGIFTERMATPAITGADLIASGLKPCPNFKLILNKTYELQLAGVSKKEILAQALAFAKTL